MQQISTLTKTVKRCRNRLDLVALSLGLTLAIVGGFLSLSIIGIVIGAPLIVAALPLLTNPRRQVCT